MKLKIENLNKTYGDKIIYKDFNLELTNEKINCIIGESGGGKSTLLNMISGLIEMDSGKIVGVNKEEISYIFQEDRLIPWITVGENLKLSAKAYYSEKDIDLKINEILELVHIRNVYNKYPEELSGGMKQRVNIGRALIKPSKLILMDEPFKSIDYKTKYSIISELKDIFKKEKRMVIFVTHNVDEAIFMEGKIYVLGGIPFNIKGIFTENLPYSKEEIIKLI